MKAYRLVKTTQPNGLIGEYTYDQYGFPSGYKDNEGRQIAFTFDEVGHLLRQKVKTGEKEWAEISATYNSYGAVTSVTDANGNKTSYEYDANTLLIKETYANGTTKQYIRDAEGNIVKIIYPQKEGDEAVKEEALYDAARRITTATDAAGNRESYTYDENGNVLTVTEEKEDGSKATIKRTYDKANRVTSYTDAEGNRIGYAYNELGQLTTLTYPDGRKVTYTYDRNNNLTSVTDWEGRITKYTYNKNGQLSKLERADKTVETYEYDKAGQLISQKDVDSKGKEIHSYDYTYNLAENITKIEKQGNSGAEASDLSAKDGKVSGEAEKKEDTTVTMEYSDDNRLISYNGEKVKYDEEGNMTYGPLDGKMTEFVYDCRNRLIKAGDTEYGYDAENNRVGVTKDGVTTKYVVDSNCEYSQVLTATTDDNVITYIYGDGLIAQESDNSNLNDAVKKPSSDDTVSLTGYITYHYNQVGSTTALTDEKGTVIEIYEYSPYGDILDGNSSLIMFLYNGKYGVASDDNGLYYMRARYYDISIKRFVNQDVVIGHLDATSSLNRYAYCEGNPVSYLDPFGLEREDTTEFIIDAIQAGLAALSIVLCVTTAGTAIPIIAVFINAVNTLIDSIRLLINLLMQLKATTRNRELKQ